MGKNFVNKSAIKDFIHEEIPDPKLKGSTIPKSMISPESLELLVESLNLIIKSRLTELRANLPRKTRGEDIGSLKRTTITPELIMDNKKLFE